MLGRLFYLCISVIILKWNLIFTTAQENVAVNKPATQISTWGFSSAWSEHNAVDGGKDCDTVDGGHYSATNSENHPWWKVDLGQLYRINMVKVFGRKSEEDHLGGFQVYLTKDDPDPDNLNSSNLVYTATNHSSTGIFSIPTSAIARYCLIKRPLYDVPLVLCEVEVYGTELSLIQRIKGNVRTSISSMGTYQLGLTSWNSENAIDGRYDEDPNTCACCSSTAGTEPSWWQIDLGDSYLVSIIKIYGRNDSNAYQSSDLWIYVGDTSMENINGHEVYHGNATEGNYKYSIQLNPARLFRFLIIRQQYQGCMTICEVQLFESVCASNTFGTNCSNHCGHCKNNITCDHVSGSCSNGCSPGYNINDPTCKTECAAGKYGQDCGSDCSGHCYMGIEQCNKVNGECKQQCYDGYMGINCTTECPFGKFGRNCNESCGKCNLIEQCDKETGICSHGCQPGYSGDKCMTECENGTFGSGCNEFCHCENDVVCEKATGRCPGYCDIMWAGDTCSEYKGFDFSHLVNATTTQVGMFANYDASKAIDKVNNYSINSCQCCSVAENNYGIPDAWWQIDLGQKYLIDALSLFGRSDNSNQEQIQGATVYAGNQSLSDNFTSGSLVYAVPSKIGSKFHFGQLLNSSIIARYFIVRINFNLLVLCEFHLRQKVCNSGSFGERCLHKCYCRNGSLCDSVTGYCPNKECKPGWVGDACNIKCEEQTFGYGCNSTCHCSSCEPGNGTCHTPCYPGWIGTSCSQECAHRKFGVNCTGTCNCFNNTSCNHENGTCELHRCDPGWQDDSCSTECKFPSFGNECNNTCHCADCEPVHGTCFVNQCDLGWKGPSCSQQSNIIALIKGNASTSMSSVYNDTWESYLAIDGNIGPDPTLCKCCARTKNEEISWWSVDLGQKYPISSITLFGRNKVPDIGQELEGFQILLSNRSSFDQTALYKDNSLHVSGSYTVEVHNQIARFIKVQRPGVLTLCEVAVHEGECAAGFFGTECSRTCKCLDMKPCSRSNGVCSTPFCQLGWRGIACDSECIPGTFGLNCQEHCFCANGEVCTSDHGICPGMCGLGYYGPQCNKECLPGTFGENCRKQCFCINGENCTKDSGTCPGACKAGYQGTQCNEEIEFDRGQNMNSSATALQKTDSSLTIGISVGVSVLVALVACLITFIICRRHRQNRAKDNNTYMQPNFNITINDSDYDTLDVPQSEYINSRPVNDQTSPM